MSPTGLSALLQAQSELDVAVLAAQRSVLNLRKARKEPLATYIEEDAQRLTARRDEVSRLVDAARAQIKQAVEAMSAAEGE